MSPLQIEILLHTYSRGDGYRGESFGSSAYKQAIIDFIGNGLIDVVTSDDTYSLYKLTPAGQATVDALMAVPMVQP